MVRKLVVFLGKIGGRIGLPFDRSLVQEDLAAHWIALSIYVMRGDVDPSTPIPIGDDNGRGFAGFMTVRTVLKTVQDGWGRWDHKTEARWCRILAEASQSLLREDAGPRR